MESLYEISRVCVHLQFAKRRHEDFSGVSDGLFRLLEQVEIKVKELYIKKGSGEKIAKNYKKMDGDLWKTVKNQVVKEAATMIESLPMDSLSKMLL